MHGPVLKSSWPSFVPHKRALGSVCTSMESGDKDRLRQTTKAGDQAAVLLALLSLLQIFLVASDRELDPLSVDPTNGTVQRSEAIIWATVYSSHVSGSAGARL
jgi:hypothetical protein